MSDYNMFCDLGYKTPRHFFVTYIYGECPLGAKRFGKYSNRHKTSLTTSLLTANIGDASILLALQRLNISF